MSPAESLNNAIGRLDFVARIAPIDPGRRNAIKRLASHWQRYFWKRTFRSMPAVTYQRMLESYARWYTRAWQLLPAESRMQCVAPSELDVSLGAAVEDEGKRIAEAVKDAAMLTSDALEAGQNAARALIDAGERAASSIAEASDAFFSRVERDVLVLLGAAIVGLYLWGRRG